MESKTAGESPHGEHAAEEGHATPTQRVRMLLGYESRDLWVVAVYAAAVGLLSLATPLAVSSLVQTVAFNTLLQPLLVLTVLLVLVLGFYSLLRALQARLVEYLQVRLFLRVAGELAHRLPRATVTAFDRAHAPELVNRFFDVLTVQKGIATILLDGLALVLQTGTGMLLLAFYHPLLLAFDVLLALGLALVLVPLGHGAVASSIEESKAKYAVAGWLEELARNPTAFRDPGGQSTALDHTESLARRYVTYRAKHWRVLFRQIVGTLALQSLAHAFLLGLGGWLVINRQLTLGQLVAAELVVTAVLSGVSKLGKQLETWYDLCAAADKLGHLLDLPLERENGEPLARSGPASATLSELHFAYTPTVQVLRKASLSIPAGARVGLLGFTGVGRSTVLDLLYGLRVPDAGVVRIDEIDQRELSLASLREQVELVRGAEVFEGTVEQNVCMGRPTVDSSAVRRALALVGLEAEIAALPDGVFTHLASGGSPLSPGEAQLLVLARALAGSPRMLLLDEALDRVAPADRPRLLDALFDPAAPWTLVVVSNSEDVLSRCTHRYELRGNDFIPTQPAR